MSASPPPLPAKLPARVHCDTGHEVTSWSGELRAVVDDKQLVIRRWSREKRRWIYWLETRWMWDAGHIKHGRLPATSPR